MNYDFTLRSLSDLIEEFSEEDADSYDAYPLGTELTRALREFRCRNSVDDAPYMQQTIDDIHDYLHNHAWPDEVDRRCRTYCVLDRHEYLSGHLLVVAYFTLCLGQIDESMLRPDMHFQTESDNVGRQTSTVPAYLIAQLACSDTYSHDDFSGASLLGLAEDMIEQASAIVGGDFIYLQCDDGLIEYYSDLGYTPAGTDSGEPPRVTMLKSIDIDKAEDDLDT